LEHSSYGTMSCGQLYLRFKGLLKEPFLGCGAPTQNFFRFLSSKGEFWCILGATFAVELRKLIIPLSGMHCLVSFFWGGWTRSMPSSALHGPKMLGSARRGPAKLRPGPARPGPLRCIGLHLPARSGLARCTKSPARPDTMWH